MASGSGETDDEGEGHTCWAQDMDELTHALEVCMMKDDVD
jgi:hypothetical protein